jgi:putative membrane protein
MLRRFRHRLITPLVAWLAMNPMFLGRQVQARYDFALEHQHWYEVEHLCFLGSSILLWWPLLRPWSSRDSYAGWHLIV